MRVKNDMAVKEKEERSMRKYPYDSEVWRNGSLVGAGRRSADSLGLVGGE